MESAGPLAEQSTLTLVGSSWQIQRLSGEHLIFARSFHACKKSGWDSDDSIPKGRNKVIKVPCLNLLVMISFGHSDFTRNYGKFPCGRSGHFYKTKFHKYPIKTWLENQLEK